MCTPLHIWNGSLYLNTGITGDHSQSTTRGIEQDTIKRVAHLSSNLATIVATCNCIPHSKTVQICNGSLLTLRFQVISNHDTFVSHQLCDVRCLPSRSSRHVHNTITGLRPKRHHWAHRCCTLKHVVTSQVFGSGTNRNGAFINLQPNLTPVRQRIETHTTLHQGCCQVFAPSLQRIHSHYQWARFIRCLKKLKAFIWSKH
mmetsp:Transcript_24551/g.36385  ORF Transcript_24551/g.36385 Transcript_24551/m.36385 type:complete len:201 (+) Transcript_24551:629-1231(+)